MRLGAPLFARFSNPKEWIAAVRAKGYRAAYCPVDFDASPREIADYAGAAAEADIVIAEVGAWCGPISRDQDKRTAALEKCKRSLALAEAIGARCCVNCSGSVEEPWYGACVDNLTPETFALIVASVRDIIDSIRPKRTFYTLEAMPTQYPASTESYLELIHEIDRPQFAVHFDPANFISTIDRYFHNGDYIRNFVTQLGPSIRSVHAKDVTLQGRMTVRLEETRPGLGTMDYRALLHALDGLKDDVPVMLEHLKTEVEYDAAAAYIRKVAVQEGLTL